MSLCTILTAMFAHSVYSYISVYKKLVRLIQLVFQSRNKRGLCAACFLLERERLTSNGEKKVAVKRVSPTLQVSFSSHVEVNKEDSTVCRCVMICVISGSNFGSLPAPSERVKGLHCIQQH